MLPSSLRLLLSFLPVCLLPYERRKSFSFVVHLLFGDGGDAQSSCHYFYFSVVTERSFLPVFTSCPSSFSFSTDEVWWISSHGQYQNEFLCPCALFHGNFLKQFFYSGGSEATWLNFFLHPQMDSHSLPYFLMVSDIFFLHPRMDSYSILSFML